MQFALMIYHTPEEFDMRKNDYSDPHLGAWRAYYRALADAGVYVGADALEVPETGTTVRLRDGKRRVQMDRMLIRRSSWQDSSSWNSLPLTLPSNGLRDAREHRSARWKSGRWRRKPCGGGSQGEWKQSGGHPSDCRACSARILWPPGGLSFRAHARFGQRRGRSQQCVSVGA